MFIPLKCPRKSPLKSHLLILLALLSLAFLGACGGDAGDNENSSPPVTTTTTGTPAPTGTTATPETTPEVPPPASGDTLQDSTLNTPLAIINGVTLTRKHFLFLANNYVMQSQNSLPEQPNDYELTETEKLEILTLLIKIQLASEEAIRLGFEPTPEEVESIYQGVINEYGGAKNLQLELNATGDTPEAFKDQITRNEALKYWRSLFFLKDARVTEAEAREFYEANITTAQHGEEVRALEILIPLPMDSEPNSQARQNARKLAQRILTEARADRDFEELIQIYMSPPALAATNNGQMGWVARDTTSLPALEEVLFSLAPGEVGEIVESPFNLHIVKVMEKRPAGVLSFAESRPEIISFLTENKIQNLLQDYLNKLVQMAEIQILDPEFKPLWEEAHLTAPDLPNPPAPEN